MNVREVYDSLGENYIEVYERIGNETWIGKYLKKFLDDGYEVLDCLSECKDDFEKLANEPAD